MRQWTLIKSMSGQLIGCHPSLYTCEEIQDEFQISQFETSTIKSWKEIKQIADYQIPNAQAQKPLIEYKGGQTNFDAPLLIACDKIANNQQFDQFSSHSVFFYTDGQAPYPAQAMEKFKNLPQNMREKIELIFCSEEDNPVTLANVVNQCKHYLASVKIQDSMKPQQIDQVWIEQVTQATHQIKNC